MENDREELELESLLSTSCRIKYTPGISRGYANIDDAIKMIIAREQALLGVIATQKNRIEELEALPENVNYSGFWGRTCARQSEKIKELEAAHLKVLEGIKWTLSGTRGYPAMHMEALVKINEAIAEIVKMKGGVDENI